MAQKKYKATHPYGGIDAAERRKARRETFIEAGLESFGTIGYVRSTIRGICQAAGLTQRYFYESFQNKEDLLVAVYRKLIQDIETDAMAILAEPGISAREAAYNMLKMFYERLQEDPRRAQVQLFEVLGVSARVNREYQSAMKTLADWIKLLVVTFFPGLEEKLPETTILHIGAAGAIIEIANQWVLEDFKTPIDEIAGQAIEAFMILGRHYHDEG
jgi:AcrR family transcriptional regulator